MRTAYLALDDQANLIRAEPEYAWMREHPQQVQAFLPADWPWSKTDLAPELSRERDLLIVTGHGGASSGTWRFRVGKKWLSPTEVLGTAKLGARVTLITACDESWSSAAPDTNGLAIEAWAKVIHTDRSLVIAQGALPYATSRNIAIAAVENTASIADGNWFESVIDACRPRLVAYRNGNLQFAEVDASGQTRAFSARG